jgi:hypothetical protein
VTEVLTGTQAVGNVESVTSSQVLALLGLVGSGQVGTVTPSATPAALTSVAASGATGTVDFIRSFALTGVGATGNVGTAGVGARTVALTGVQASGAAGNVIAVYWILVETS